MKTTRELFCKNIIMCQTFHKVDNTVGNNRLSSELIKDNIQKEKGEENILQDQKIKEIFEMAEKKYSNKFFDQGFLHYNHILVLSDFSKNLRSIEEEIKEKLNKSCKDKFSIKIINDITRKIGLKKGILNFDDVFKNGSKKRIICYVYFKSQKDKLLTILKVNNSL